MIGGREWMQDLIKIKSCFNASWSVCVSRSMVHGSTRELILYLWSLEKISFERMKSWANSVHIGSNISCSFFPLLLYSACIYSSLFFWTLFFLLYLLHPSDSFPFSSLLFSCSLFKCTCPKCNCNSWYRISWQGVKSWVNSVHIGSDISCSFFPLLLYSACIYSSLFFSTLFFSFTFSILLILSLSLLYSFHVVSLSAFARSLTVIVDIGSLGKKLNLELILFILVLVSPPLSVGMGSLEKELNLELILFLLTLIPHALSSLFLPTLLVYVRPFSFQLSCFSFIFSIFLILSLSLVYYFHVVSLSAIARSLTVIVDIRSLEKDIKLWVNSVHIGSDTSCSFSWYRISWDGIKSWVNSVQIVSDTSCSFFPLLPYSACIYFPSSFQLLFFSFTFSILLILSLSLLYSFHVVSLNAIARSLTVIVDTV